MLGRDDIGKCSRAALERLWVEVEREDPAAKEWMVFEGMHCVLELWIGFDQRDLVEFVLHAVGVEAADRGEVAVANQLLDARDEVTHPFEAHFVVDTNIESLGDKMIAAIEAKRAALGI